MPLDMTRSGKKFSIDDGFNLLKLSVRDAEKDNSLRLMVSTYDPMDQIIRDGYYDGGRKVVTFANILKHNAFPLATILDSMLTVGSREMGRPVEIEFAGNLTGANGAPGTVYWLQIRPIVDMKEMLNDEVMDLPDEKTILKSNTALGHGVMDNVCHIVYVKSQNFKPSNNVNIARENRKNKSYLYRAGRVLYSHWTRPMGVERLLIGHTGEMASHLVGASHCRVGPRQLPHRTESRDTLLPKPDLVWRGLFHGQLICWRRLLRRGLPRQPAGSVRVGLFENR